MKKRQAILMAAGVGSRISAHTHRPKSTLDVSGSGDTIIEHTLKILEKHDFKVNVVVGYRKENVKSLLKNHPVRFFENPFYRITNSVGSLWFARDALVKAQENGQDVVLANADVFFGEELLEKLLADEGGFVMLGDKTRTEVGDYFFKTDEEGTLLDNGKGMSEEDRSCEYVGIAKISAEMLPFFITQLDYLIWCEKYNMWWEDALYSFKELSPVKILDVDGLFWGEVDTIEDYQRILDYVSGHAVEG